MKKISILLLVALLPALATFTGDASAQLFSEGNAINIDFYRDSDVDRSQVDYGPYQTGSSLTWQRITGSGNTNLGTWTDGTNNIAISVGAIAANWRTAQGDNVATNYIFQNSGSNPRTIDFTISNLPTDGRYNIYSITGIQTFNVLKSKVTVTGDAGAVEQWAWPFVGGTANPPSPAPGTDGWVYDPTRVGEFDSEGASNYLMFTNITPQASGDIDISVAALTECVVNGFQIVRLPDPTDFYNTAGSGVGAANWSDINNWYGYSPAASTTPLPNLQLAYLVPTDYTANYALRSTVIWDVGTATYSGILSGVGGLEIDSANTLTLSGANTYTGDTTITAGTLSIEGAGTLGTGAVTNNTTLNFNDTNGQTIDNLISGSGTVTKTGTGTITLSGANTYTGGTTIAAGTLLLGVDDALPAAGDLAIVAGGILDTNGTDASVGALSGDGNIENNHATETTSLAIQSGTFAGSIQDDIGVTKTNSGTLTLSGALAYTGDTTVNDGTLDVNGGIYGGQASGTFVVTGGTLDLADANFSTMTAGSTLSFTLPTEATPGDHFVAPATPLALTNLTLQLDGGYQYNKAFVDKFVPTNVELAAGTTLTIAIAYNAGAPTGGITIAGQTTINPADLKITLTGFDTGVPEGSTQEFIVIDSASMMSMRKHLGVGTTDWTADDYTALAANTIGGPSGSSYDTLIYEINSNNDLVGNYTKLFPPSSGGGTNPEAVAELENNPNLTPGSPSELFQQLLRGTASDLRKDQLTQQFTVSMASASYTAAVQGTSQVMQCVASQFSIPMETQSDRVELVRGQVGYVNSIPANYAKSTPVNLWFQAFGTAGEQASRQGFAGYDTSSYGFAAGSDFQMTDSTHVGFAYGYSNGKLDSQGWDWDDAKNPANALAQNHTLLFYSFTKLNQKWFWLNKIGGMFGEVNSTRVTPEMLNGERFHYTGKTNSGMFLYQATLGYQLYDQGDFFTFTPKVKFSAYSYGQGSYVEECLEQTAPMSVGSFSDAYCQFDFLLDHKLRLLDGLTYTGSIGYRSVIDAKGAVLSVSGDGSNPYNVIGMNPATDIFVFDSGFEYVLTSRTSFVGEYNYRAGNGSKLHGGTGTLVVAF